MNGSDDEPDALISIVRKQQLAFIGLLTRRTCNCLEDIAYIHLTAGIVSLINQ